MHDYVVDKTHTLNDIKAPISNQMHKHHNQVNMKILVAVILVVSCAVPLILAQSDLQFVGRCPNVTTKASFNESQVNLF